jgi:NodT family efflux transporter outer membrane factor (OMF) lipoprotein
MGQPEVAQETDSGTVVHAAWWEEFNDPQLTRFVLLALEQNLGIEQASARVMQARAGLGMANAALLPSGAVNGQAARAYQSIETPVGRLLNENPGYNRWGSAYEADLTASWEIDLFGGLRRSREAAQAEYQAAEAGVAASRLAVAAQTAETYITIRSLQVRLDIARKQVGTQQELLSKIKLLYGKGLAPESQVQQTESALAQDQATVPVIQAGLNAAMNAMDVMLGAPAGTYRAQLTEAAGIPAAPQVMADSSPAELLRYRPDLIVAERHLVAANARIGVAIAEYYPKLSLGGLVGSATSLSSGNLFTSGASQAAGIVGLRWRLFDFGRINAQIQFAHGQEAEALIAYRQSVLEATAEVENALSALANRREQAIALTESEASLSRSRDSSVAAYQRGAVSQIEVLQADKALLAVSESKAQAQTESARAAVAAFKAFGGGWQSDVFAN